MHLVRMKTDRDKSPDRLRLTNWSLVKLIISECSVQRPDCAVVSLYFSSSYKMC